MIKNTIDGDSGTSCSADFVSALVGRTKVVAVLVGVGGAGTLVAEIGLGDWVFTTTLLVGEDIGIAVVVCMAVVLGLTGTIPLGDSLGLTVALGITMVDLGIGRGCIRISIIQ